MRNYHGKPAFASKSPEFIICDDRLLHVREPLFLMVVSRERILSWRDELGTGAIGTDFWNDFSVL